jgi:mannitol-1-/sugar-/sorbitol-6-phosphatase
VSDEYRVRGVLFDCDGVLVDSLASAGRAWDAWAARWAPHFDYHTQMVHGRRAGDTVRELVDADVAEEAELELEQDEIREAVGTEPIPGARELTSSLDVRWAVVTSGTRDLATARLASAGIPTPNVLVAAQDVTRGKPDPEPYAQGAERIGVAPADCVVFEDAMSGIIAARAAGIGVVIGVGPDALGHGADAVVPDLRSVRIADGVLTVRDRLD